MSTIKEELRQIVEGPELSEKALRQHLLDLVTTPVKPRKMSYEEFLEWTDEDTMAEWVDGEIVMHSPAGDRHQDLAGFLESLLRIYTQNRQLGIVRSAPFQMKLPRSGREPDVMFVARNHLERLQATYLDGPADLVIEIISPESIGRDRGDKHFEYEEAGIHEYWLVDPEHNCADFYQLSEEGRYRLISPDSEGVYRSAQLPGFWLRVAWLWQETLPEIDEVLLEIGGQEYAGRLIERLRQRGFLA